jgi:hypothetical protein
LELRRENNPRSRVGSLDDESFMVSFNNEAMELFMSDNFTV